jgi:hypothetical protein
MNGDDTCIQNFDGKAEGKRPLGRPWHRWKKILLKWMVNTVDGKVWIGFFWVRLGVGMGPSKHCNEHMGCIKCREFVL